MKKNTFIKMVLVAILLTNCKNEDKTTSPVTNTGIDLKNHSVSPSFVTKQTGFENLEIFSLVGSDDVLELSPNYIFGGSADGSGLLRNTDETFSYITNHEDNFAISRITLDRTFKPIKGEYILNSDGGQWRLCSATLATPEEHGFGPVFITSGESGEESQTHQIDPYKPANSSSSGNPIAAFGRLSAENAVPLGKNAYAGKTVVLIGDDDSGTYGGQVYMYVSNTIGDLNNGDLYVLKRTNENQKERDMVVGQSYPIKFEKINNQKTLTGAQINAQTDVLKALKFGRVEDLDYGKGSSADNRKVYFNVTGQNNTGANADNSRSKYGRVYRLNLDETSPLTGNLELLLDGDDRSSIAGTFQNVDNILVTQNYVYIQEDPNSYGDETHDAYIYQYNIATKSLKKVLELNHYRNDPALGTKYGGASSTKGSWEYGALIDVSDIIGVNNTFMLNIQPHTWRGDKYKGVDGGSLRTSENQASQVIVIKGLPR